MLAKIIQDGLRKHGFTIIDTKEIQHGTQIRLVEGAIINVYKSPKVLVQGKAISSLPLNCARALNMFFQVALLCGR